MAAFVRGVLLGALFCPGALPQATQRLVSEAELTPFIRNALMSMQQRPAAGADVTDALVTSVVGQMRATLGEGPYSVEALLDAVEHLDLMEPTDNAVRNAGRGKGCCTSLANVRPPTRSSGDASRWTSRVAAVAGTTKASEGEQIHHAHVRHEGVGPRL